VIREILQTSEGVPERTVLILPRLRPPYDTIHMNQTLADAYLRMIKDVPREFGIITGIRVDK